MKSKTAHVEMRTPFLFTAPTTFAKALLKAFAISLIGIFICVFNIFNLLSINIFDLFCIFAPKKNYGRDLERY